MKGEITQILNVNKYDHKIEIINTTITRVETTLQIKNNGKYYEKQYRGDFTEEDVIGAIIEFEIESVIERFIRRLNKIGVTVKLVENYPWVYLSEVNGKKINSKFKSAHAFTAFYQPTRKFKIATFSDRKEVFNEIREML